MTIALEAWSANDEAQALLADMGAKEAKIWALNSWEHYGAIPLHSAPEAVARNVVRLAAFWKDVHTLLRLENASDEGA